VGEKAYDRDEMSTPGALTSTEALFVSTSLLDNPMWSALTTDHAGIALGGERARRYPEETGPLSGMAEVREAGFEELREATRPGSVAVVFCQEKPRVPQGWELVRDGVLVQMAARQPVLVPVELPGEARLRPLTRADATEMVALAELTEPGPFRLRTIELGGYYGIFHGDRLMAMAGKRLSMPGFVEVSAVCTHPEARGRGYAPMLMGRVMEEILEAGKAPFLHTWAGNAGAIRIYERLGFVLRRRFELAVVRRTE
jgi:predicted GNAT family acetyltransferase